MQNTSGGCLNGTKKSVSYWLDCGGINVWLLPLMEADCSGMCRWDWSIPELLFTGKDNINFPEGWLVGCQGCHPFPLVTDRQPGDNYQWWDIAHIGIYTGGCNWQMERRHFCKKIESAVVRTGYTYDVWIAESHHTAIATEVIRRLHKKLVLYFELRDNINYGHCLYLTVYFIYVIYKIQT